MTTQTQSWSQQLGSVNALRRSAAEQEREFRQRVGHFAYSNCFNAHARATGSSNRPQKEPDAEQYQEYCKIQAAEKHGWQVENALHSAMHVAVRALAEERLAGLAEFILLEQRCDCGWGFHLYPQAAQFLDHLGIPAPTEKE